MALLCTANLYTGAVYGMEERYFGYRGYVPGTVGRTINAMAMRSDARYLYFSSGSSFEGLDLLDLARTGDAVATNGVVFGLFLLNDTRLAAATANGVQYFNLQYPFSVTEDTAKFSRNATSDLSVSGSCMTESQRIQILETSTSANKHLLRTVAGTSQTASLEWVNVFAGASTSTDQLYPLGIRCAPQSVYVIAYRKDPSNALKRDEIWVSVLDAATLQKKTAFPLYVLMAYKLNGFNGTGTFTLVDYVLSQKNDQLLMLFNRTATEPPAIEDSIVMVIPETGTGFYPVRVGSGARAVSSFSDGSQVYQGLFVFQDLVNKLVERFVYSKAENFRASLNQDLLSSGSDKFGKSGVGLSTAGGKMGSLWLSSKNDYFSYGATESTGVTLISNRPPLEFTSNPMGQTLSSGTATLNFNLKSDTLMNYEIRVDEDLDERGTTSGLTRTPGRVVKSGTSNADGTFDAFQLKPSELGLTKNQTHSLYIFGRAESDGSSDLWTRIGLTFEYDPPPGKVLGFRTGWGDQSAEAVFSLPSDGDIAKILIHFSYDRNDLETLPTSSAELKDRTVATGVKDGTLTSPVQIVGNYFSGSYVIAPIQNGKEIFIRPQLIDKSGQYSTENAETQSATPYRTLTLPQALGSEASCALATKAQFDSSYLWCSLLGLWAVVGIRLGRKKLGPALLRNRRGGD